LTKYYIVVHHKQDINQPWVNSWLDDHRLDAIQTTRKVAEICDTVHRNEQHIFVHRCAFGSLSPSICCSASVTSVQKIDRKTWLVKFSNQQILSGTRPPAQPMRGQNYYVIHIAWKLSR